MLRKPAEWVEDDLLALIGAAEKESIDLEYKACDSLQNTDQRKNEISKDVSAMANSAGGTIVYGIRENGYIPTGIDVGFDPAAVTKEWLEQVINSRIRRRIDGVRIRAVDLVRTHPGRVAYVVSIPQATGFPHQAADKKFYKRFNFESVPMEEYEIRDVANRVTVPRLRITLDLADGEVAALGFSEGASGSHPIGIRGTISNDSIVPAYYAFIRLSFDARLQVRFVAPSFGGLSVTQATFRGKTIALQAIDQAWKVPERMPIFQGVDLRLSDGATGVIVPPGPGEYVVGWGVRTPGAELQSGYAILQSDGRSAQLVSAKDGEISE